MNSFFEDIIVPMITITLGMLGVIAGFIWLFSFTPIAEEISIRNKEWNQKVNICLLDMKARNDCELIIYKDRQIKAHKEAEQTRSTILTTGLIMSSLIGGRK